jgi:hypothetical protein
MVWGQLRLRLAKAGQSPAAPGCWQRRGSPCSGHQPDGACQLSLQALPVRCHVGDHVRAMKDALPNASNSEKDCLNRV